MWLCPVEGTSYSAGCCLCRSEIGLLRVRWQNSNSIYWFETQCHFAFVWGSRIVPPLSLTQLVTGMERKSKSHATVVFLDPLKAAVQCAVSQWLDHLLVFEWISFGGIFIKGRMDVIPSWNTRWIINDSLSLALTLPEPPVCKRLKCHQASLVNHCAIS